MRTFTSYITRSSEHGLLRQTIERGVRHCANISQMRLTLISDEILEPIIKEIISEYLKERTHTAQFQYGFTQTKSCQTNWISSFNRVSSLIDQGLLETLQTRSGFQPGIWQIFWCLPCWQDNWHELDLGAIYTWRKVTKLVNNFKILN